MRSEATAAYCRPQITNGLLLVASLLVIIALIAETTVYVSVPPGTSSRELDCKIKTNSVSLKYKDGRPPILIGDFPLAVKPGEVRSDEERSDSKSSIPPTHITNNPSCARTPSQSLWSLDRDSSQIVLNLDKVQRTWWDCAVSGDTKIDTSKVDSTMKVRLNGLQKQDAACRSATASAIF